MKIKAIESRINKRIGDADSQRVRLKREKLVKALQKKAHREQKSETVRSKKHKLKRENNLVGKYLN